MKATSFEYRYQRLLHLGIVGLAFLTYAVDKDDVVWRFVKASIEPHRWERYLFIAAGVLVAAGAVVCTWARAWGGDGSLATKARARQIAERYWGELCYAIGLGALFPLSGFALLVMGEALRIFRLLGRASGNAREIAEQPFPEAGQVAAEMETDLGWAEAFRREAIKWGLVLTMIVFVVTLRDRDADVLVAASLVIGIALNAPSWCHAEEARAGAGSSWPN